MKQLLGIIVQNIVSSIIAAITQRWDREQAEADRAAAKAREWQLEQAREHLRVQAAMREKMEKADAPSSGAAWNAGRLIALALLLTGCFRHYVPVHTYIPVPPLPERPVLEDESPFNDREQALAGYAVRVETALAEARAFAIEQNLANGYAVEPADEAWLHAYRSR